MDLRELNKLLSKGILPEELDFTIKPRPEIDINKIKYNAFYRTYEFAESKFPPGYENIPGFDKIIESVRQGLENITPLEEMEFRQKQSKIIVLEENKSE
jgi:hypothetical protein